METKFTPGPWIHDGLGIMVDARPVSGDHPVSATTGTSPVASICGYHGDRYTQIANANLIAAAPELYTEHAQWASTLGQMAVAILQGDLRAANIIACELKIEFNTDGSPRVASAALAKARGE